MQTLLSCFKDSNPAEMLPKNIPSIKIITILEMIFAHNFHFKDSLEPGSFLGNRAKNHWSQATSKKETPLENVFYII